MKPGLSRAFALLLVLLAGLRCQGAGTPRSGPPEPEPEPPARDASATGGRGPAPGPSNTGGASADASASLAFDAAAAADATGPAAKDAAPAADGSASSLVDAAADGAAGEGGVGAAGPWARGIRISLVEGAQSVFVRLGDGTTVVAPAMRNSPLFEGRPIYLRVHVATDAGFTARPLRAVLTVEQEDGSKLELGDTKTISGPSNVEKLETTFNVLVPAEAVKPKAKLTAAVYEAGPAAGPEPARPPRFPTDGALDLAIKAGPMVLDVVLVPAVGPSGPLDDAPARRKRVEQHLYEVYPVQKVNVRWREPLRFTSKIAYPDGFRALQTARMQDGAKPGEYYHLLYAHEDTTETYLGIAQMAGATVGDAARRIGITFVTGHVVDSLLDTISHEMGHNHGRSHTPGCNAQGVDMNFPYPNTGVGVNGWGLLSGTFKSARTLKDLMGYCNGTWVSDYTWRGFEGRVRAVSALSAAPGGAPLAVRSLQGFATPGRPIDWAVVPGPLAAGAVITGGRQARVVMADGAVVLAPVSVQPLSDDRSRELAVDLPPEGEVARVELLVDGARHVFVP
jgi:hypothetical protein